MMGQISTIYLNTSIYRINNYCVVVFTRHQPSLVLALFFSHYCLVCYDVSNPHNKFSRVMSLGTWFIFFVHKSIVYMYLITGIMVEEAMTDWKKKTANDQWRSYYGLKYSTNLPIILIFKVCLFCRQRNAFITSEIAMALVDIHDVAFVCFRKDTRISK